MELGTRCCHDCHYTPDNNSDNNDNDDNMELGTHVHDIMIVMNNGFHDLLGCSCALGVGLVVIQLQGSIAQARGLVVLLCLLLKALLFVVGLLFVLLLMAVLFVCYQWPFSTTRVRRQCGGCFFPHPCWCFGRSQPCRLSDVFRWSNMP